MDNNRRRIEDLVMRIEGEFLEAPELKLTVPQAQRRFGVDEMTCEAVLDALVDAAVLFKTAASFRDSRPRDTTPLQGARLRDSFASSASFALKIAVEFQEPQQTSVA